MRSGNPSPPTRTVQTLVSSGLLRCERVVVVSAIKEEIKFNFILEIRDLISSLNPVFCIQLDRMISKPCLCLSSAAISDSTGLISALCHSDRLLGCLVQNRYLCLCSGKAESLREQVSLGYFKRISLY